MAVLSRSRSAGVLYPSQSSTGFRSILDRTLERVEYFREGGWISCASWAHLYPLKPDLNLWAVPTVQDSGWKDSR